MFSEGCILNIHKTPGHTSFGMFLIQNEHYILEVLAISKCWFLTLWGYIFSDCSLDVLFLTSFSKTFPKHCFLECRLGLSF